MARVVDSVVSRRSLLGGALAASASAAAGMAGPVLTAPMAQAAPVTPSSGRFVAWFVNPGGWANQAAMETALRALRTDVVTMGPRLYPVARTTGDPYWKLVPSQVRAKLGSRKVYYYAGDFIFNTSLKPGPVTVMTIGSYRWSIWPMGDNVVVVFRAPVSAFDKTTQLILAGNTVGAKVVPGIPRPVPVKDQPDLSYQAVLNTFTGYWARDMKSRGADGFYQGFEMVASPKSYWDSVISLYAGQNAAIAGHIPGANVLVSPYMVSNHAVPGWQTTASTAAGLSRIAGTAKGTKLWLSPQDGLGTDAQAPTWEPHAGWDAPLENYLAAARQAVGTSRLYVTTEVFRNNRSTSRSANPYDRIPTTRSRVSSQLWCEKDYTRGSIGYFWNESGDRVDLSGSKISGLTNFSAGFGKLFV